MIKILVITFVSIQCVSNVFTQNLIRNGDFETHGKLDCVSCPMWPDKFAAVLPGWQNINGSYPFLCDCRQKTDNAALEQGICRYDKALPIHGKSMMQLAYMPSCYDQDMATRGCSSYLGSKLSAPLEVGKVYVISFWLFLPMEHDTAFAKNIGVNLYTEPIRNPNGKLLSGAAFTLDTVVWDQWYQVKWMLRPTCALRFFLLGVFRDKSGPPVNSLGYTNWFFIDDIQVLEYTGETGNQKILPFCKSQEQNQEPLPAEVEGTTIFFDTNDTLLSPDARQSLDAFAARARRSPLAAFVIAGNTDDSGLDNVRLSEWRVKNTLRYLEQQHRIKPCRFLELYNGASNPLAPNDTESGREKNRRVEIRQTDGELANVVYRNLLLRLFEGKVDEAFDLMQIWLHTVKSHKKLYVLFDPRLERLKSDPRWKAKVYLPIRASYAAYKKPEQAFLLDSLGRDDQKCRTLKHYLENLNAYYAPVDSLDKRFDVSFFTDSINDECAAQDRARFGILKKTIGEKDWPKASEIGERAAKGAFLMLSHSEDSTALARYVPLLRQRCMEGEASWEHYAMLYDRLQVMRDLPQRYGTQYRPPGPGTATLELFPLEDAGKVNVWRKEIGLEPLEF